MSMAACLHGALGLCLGDKNLTGIVAQKIVPQMMMQASVAHADRDSATIDHEHGNGIFTYAFVLHYDYVRWPQTVPPEPRARTHPKLTAQPWQLAHNVTNSVTVQASKEMQNACNAKVSVHFISFLVLRGPKPKLLVRLARALAADKF